MQTIEWMFGSPDSDARPEWASPEIANDLISTDSASSTELSQSVAYFAIPCSAVGYRGLLARHFVFYSGGMSHVWDGIEMALVAGILSPILQTFWQ